MPSATRGIRVVMCTPALFFFSLFYDGPRGVATTDGAGPGCIRSMATNLNAKARHAACINIVGMGSDASRMQP